MLHEAYTPHCFCLEYRRCTKSQQIIDLCPDISSILREYSVQGLQQIINSFVHRKVSIKMLIAEGCSSSMPQRFGNSLLSVRNVGYTIIGPTLGPSSMDTIKHSARHGNTRLSLVSSNASVTSERDNSDFIAISHSSRTHLLVYL